MVSEKQRQMSATISIDDLRVGMYVHLDLRWWAHPFALSSFLVTSSDEVAKIRALGLKELRWSPERSRLEPVPEAGDAALGAALGDDAGRASDGADSNSPSVDEYAAESADAEQAGAGQSVSAQQRRAELAEQRRASQLVQRQYTEAAQAWTAITETFQRTPADARQTAEAITQAMLQKMLGDQDMCIRMISEGAGDRSTLHALNVTVLSMLMGRSFGFDTPAMSDVGVGALLHDIGKLELPSRVRHLDGGFTAAELSLYRSHVARGITQAQRMGLTPGATAVIAQHHELADGSGYPVRLSGARIDPASRIIALVDRFDNLCNPLLPHLAMTPHEAVSLLFAQNQNKFDVTMLGAFIRMMGVYPPGSVVQLTDERYGLVIGVNSSRPLKPRVLVHDPRVAADEALVLDLQAFPDLGVRRSLKPSAIPAESQHYLSPRQRIAYFFEPQPAVLVAEGVD